MGIGSSGKQAGGILLIFRLRVGLRLRFRLRLRLALLLRVTGALGKRVLREARVLPSLRLRNGLALLPYAAGQVVGHADVEGYCDGDGHLGMRVSFNLSGSSASVMTYQERGQ